MADLKNLVEDVLGTSSARSDQHIVAIHTIVCISMEEYTNSKTLLINGKRLFEAMEILCNSDVKNTIIGLNQFLQPNKQRKINLKIVNSEIEIDVRNMTQFQLVTIMAFNFVPCCKKNKATIISALVKLFDFMEVKNPQSILILKTACRLMQQFIEDKPVVYIERLVLQTANQFLALCPFNKAVSQVERMVGIILNGWTQQRRTKELVTLCYHSDVWHANDIYMISWLITTWNTLGPCLLSLLEHIAERLTILLTLKNFFHGAMKVLKAAIPFMPVEFWNSNYVSLIIRNMPEDMDKQRSYMKTVVAPCGALALKRYGEEAYSSLTNKSSEMYRIIIIYCGVHNGVLSVEVEDIDLFITRLLQGPTVILQEYAFKSLCAFNNHFTPLPKHTMNLVFEYLLRNNIHTEYFKDCDYFFSHLCVTANKSVNAPYKTNTIDSCAKLLPSFYNRCIALISSRNEEQISIGVTLVNIIRNAFESNYLNLKTKYKVLPEEERYSEKEAPSFKLFSARGQWPFNERPLWDVYYNVFKQNIKINCDLALAMNSWIVSSLPRGSDDHYNLFFGGVQRLRTGYEDERTQKGLVCIELGLHDKSTSVQLVNELISNIRIITNTYGDFNNFTVLNKWLAETGLLGFTRCMNLLLKKPDAKMSLRFVLEVFEFCASCAKRILGIICLEKLDVMYTPPCKAVEYLLLECMEMMTIVVKEIGATGPNLSKALEIANKVIRISNLKKPVTSAARIIQEISLTIMKLEDMNFQPFLCRTMEFLLGILSDSTSASSSIASALHTVEIILSDNSLRISTLPFVNPMMVHCINAFSSKDWQIKNAAVQVLKALTDRLLGQKCNNIYRCHRIEDIFLLIPKIGIYFYSKLEDVHIDRNRESVVAILAIFSESHRSSSLFLPIGVKIVTDSFLKIFLDIVCTNTTPIGTFAAKAYAALYPHLYIPFIIRDIVDCLILRFDKMKKNIFYTYLCLLQALYERFNIAFYVSYYKLGLNIIESSLQKLTMFLEKFNVQYEYSLFSLLNVKSNSISNIKKAVLQQLDLSTYQSRLWLNNNVPYLLNHIEVKKFPNMLKICFSTKSSLSLKICSLQAVVNRHQELLKHCYVDDTLLVLLESLFELSFTENYLLMLLSNVIFLLFEFCDFKTSEDLLYKIRLEYKRIGSYSSIYFVSIFIRLLSDFSTYNISDKLFFKNAIQVYKNACIVEDNQLNFQAASTLKYLYKCVEVSERHEVLKLAFILLLNDETSFEIQKFVTQVFGVNFCSMCETLEVLISFDYLIKELCSEITICSYLLDLTVLICSLKDFYEVTGSFYLKQNSNICLHKYTVKEILLKQIRKAFILLPRKTCCELLLNVNYILTHE